MIPKHKHLGDLVTSDRTWHRPITPYHLGKEEWNALDDWCWDNKCYKECMGGGNLAWGGHAEWWVVKDKPFSLIAEENDGIKHIEKDWRNTFIGIQFNNGEFCNHGDLNCDVEGTSVMDESQEKIGDYPIIIDETNRCKGIINMEGDRCKGQQYHEEFCAGCKKYDDKVKAGKLRECKYCSSTFHSTRSCKQNPKVIEKERLHQEWMNKHLSERRES